jgi:hypothetical protein
MTRLLALFTFRIGLLPVGFLFNLLILLVFYIKGGTLSRKK